MTRHLKSSPTVKTSLCTSGSLDSVPLHSPSRRGPLGPWFPNIVANVTFIWTQDFGPLSSGPVLFLHSPVRMLLMLSLAQEWPDTRNGTPVAHLLTPATVRSLGSHSKFSNPWRLRPSLLLLHLIPPHFSLPVNFPWVCVDTALCKQPALSATTLCGLPS